MAIRRKSIGLTIVAVLIVVLVFLSGSAGVTAYAAQSALPGDALYPVKTSIEQTRLSMANDAAARAELHMAFAELRLKEVAGLIVEGRYQNISTATLAFEKYINQAIAEIEVVAQGDPQRAALLTAQISEALSRYARTLTSMLASVPDPVRADMMRVIESPQLRSTPVGTGVESEFTGVVESMTPGAWLIGGRTVFLHTQTELKGTVRLGDTVRVHASLNGDGDLVAREIEPVAVGDGNENANDNGNGNGNLNGNANGNTNDSAGANANGNANLNGNANESNANEGGFNGNANQNSNEDRFDDHGGNQNGNDDSQNSNDDSGSNSNDDSQNSNDDHGGSNSNDDSGSNSNDDDDDDDDSGKGRGRGGRDNDDDD